MGFEVGSLVKARGREWVVLPSSKDHLLMLRPLGGTEDETTGVHTQLETIEPATFALPDPHQNGDHRSSRLLRDAVRLGFRSSAGPFRSFGKIAVEPRPYQLVPLMLALKLEPVRLLIADDVGIGKTVEAALIARELLDRGEISSFAVLCPPHLAEQWVAELREKFNLDATLVLASTAARLERGVRFGESLLEHHPITVISMDYIKSERRREEFLRHCPELVIVDEAHTCVDAGDGRGGSHQRHHLLRGIAKEASRHLMLVTATPHSGNTGAFRSLLALLKPEFAHLPEDLSGPQNAQHRRDLAAHFVQRQRADIRRYMESDTPFPDRLEKDETYALSAPYRKLFEDVLSYARETVLDPNTNERTQRVRWWSALALLRSLASSPAAAAATLRNRASTASATTAAEADALGRLAILDQTDDESLEGVDVAPGADDSEEGAGGITTNRLNKMAKEADALKGKPDAKLQGALEVIAKLIAEGHNPIVFCRYIPTAEYVAEALRKHLPKAITVAAVTGTLPPEEREARVSELSQAERRVLVATDCLSEGINLQRGFDAVLHYDLSWNPTRHEQRQGRVDRYGQPKKTVRVVTYYGRDNQVDGIVLDVLIRKHERIRKDTGISVPIPMDNDSVVKAIFEGLLLRPQAKNQESLFDSLPMERQLEDAWRAASEREKRSRTMFAQESIKVDEVARALREVRDAIGSGVDVRGFVIDALHLHGCTVQERRDDSILVDLTGAPRALRDRLPTFKRNEFAARFEPPNSDHELLLSRTHPIVEALAQFVMDSALDSLPPENDHDFRTRRCGVTRTDAVDTRTTLMLTRFRYHIVSTRNDKTKELLAEDCQLLRFEGAPNAGSSLELDVAEPLLVAEPRGNVTDEQKVDYVSRVVSGMTLLSTKIDDIASARGNELLEAHLRVRDAAKLGGRYKVVAQLPPDILSIHVLIPAPLPMAAD